MSKLKARIQSLSKETLFALTGVSIFFASFPWIHMLFPTSAPVDRGGNFHVMLSGLMAYTVAFPVVLVTIGICFRTYWKYAVKPPEKFDADGEPNIDDEGEFPTTFADDWKSATPALRITVFVASFFGLLTLAAVCLTP